LPTAGRHVVSTLSAAWNLILADARQIPLQNYFSASPSTKHESWDFFEKPSQDSTSHLIFDTVNSFLQHWPNTRYRNGHSIVPGTIPIGTLLYHGTSRNEIPRSPDWTAIDPEHSYFFCFPTPADSGCWHLTLVATRPLRVLYFDGSSAAKFHGGSMDSQEVLIWGEAKPEWIFEERKRINDLCEWGKQYGIDGFVRMEMDFEVVLCDFTTGVEVVSFHHLTAREHDPDWKGPPPPERKDLDSSRNITYSINIPTNFRSMEAGGWHNHFPGETRVHLNYAGVVSFYDTALFPSLKVLRSKKERWDHRLEGISSEDVQTLLKTLGGILDGAWDRPVSRIDWKTLLRVVMDRYVGRLQVLNRVLNSTMLNPEANTILALNKTQSLMSGMLSPYRLYSVSPPPDIRFIPKLSWATPVFKECATTHTRYVDSLLQNLTYSERLLLDSTKMVSKEICRVVVRMWAEGMEHTVSKESSSCSDRELLARWKGLTEELMSWLDWSEWVTCRPACGDEEICYLPTWPFFTSKPGDQPPLSRRSKLGEVNDSVKPQPRCLRRKD